MNLRLNPLVLSPLLAVLALACGDPAAEGDPSAPAKPSLAGRYTSACFDSGGTATKLAFDLEESSWKLDYQTFGDAACSAPFLTVRIEGDYALTAPSSRVAAAWDARFGFTKRTVTPFMTPAVDLLTSAKGCGGGTYAVGTATDIAAGCAGLGMYPIATCAQDFDVVTLDGDKLAFGKRPADNDMCTEAKRPSELSPLVLSRGG